VEARGGERSAQITPNMRILYAPSSNIKVRYAPRGDGGEQLGDERGGDLEAETISLQEAPPPPADAQGREGPLSAFFDPSF
jgi:hypothetical protein